MQTDNVVRGPWMLCEWTRPCVLWNGIEVIRGSDTTSHLTIPSGLSYTRQACGLLRATFHVLLACAIRKDVGQVTYSAPRPKGSSLRHPWLPERKVAELDARLFSSIVAKSFLLYRYISGMSAEEARLLAEISLFSIS